MKSDEKRSHRLNQLLQVALTCDMSEAQLFVAAKKIGVSDATARDYVRTVLIQLSKMKKKKNDMSTL